MLSKLRTTVKQTAIYSISNIALKLSGLILLPIYANNITIAAFGLLALFESTSEIIVSISDFGITKALNRWYWDKEVTSKKSLTYTTHAFSIVSSLVFLSITYYILISFWQKELSEKLIILFIGATFSKILFSFPMQLMRIHQRAINQTTICLTNLSLTVLLTWYFVAIQGLKIEGIFLSQLISNSLCYILTILYLKNNMIFNFDFKIFKKIFSYAFPLAISSITTIILVQSDKYMISIITGGNEQVGTYSLGYKLANILKIIILHSFMHSYIHSFFRNMNEDDSSRFNKKILTYFSFISILAGLSLAIFGREIVETFASSNKNYWGAIRIIPILVIGISFSGIYQMLILPLTKLKKTVKISIITISGGVLNVALNIIMIKKFGDIGAAYSTLITQFLLIITYFIINWKLNNIFEYSKIILLYILGIIIYLISYLFIDLNIFLRLIFKTILIVIFPIILYYLNFYEAVELNRINGSIRKWKNKLFKI